jgi:hypothetical protein
MAKSRVTPGHNAGVGTTNVRGSVVIAAISALTPRLATERQKTSGGDLPDDLIAWNLDLRGMTLLKITLGVAVIATTCEVAQSRVRARLLMSEGGELELWFPGQPDRHR